jgi:uncharacterized protein (TIGR00661 family)
MIMLIPEKQLHVLTCPLNWGLGHASRMIPLVREFLKLGHRVTVAAAGYPLELLKTEFSSSVDYVEFPGPQISYGRGDSQFLKLSVQIPPFLLGIYKESKYVENLVALLQPDIIISDNRYGVKSKKTFSVFVTHQVNIKLPSPVKWLEGILHKINQQFLESFDLCLVPDYPEAPGLSGNLSHGALKSEKLMHIGPLSRFQMDDKAKSVAYDDDLPDGFIVVILSGPEPQRTILEELLKKQLTAYRSIWFRGLPGEGFSRKKGMHYYYDHADTEFMTRCIMKSRLVISRSGYSTVMDLAMLGKKCVMIPTPGQSEQEYLGKTLHEAGYIVNLPQKRITELNDAIDQALLKPGLPRSSSENTLDDVVKEIIRMAAEKKISA